MLLIVTHTGRSWAWVLKHPERNLAVCVGFGHKTEAAARAAGTGFAEIIKED